MDFQLYTPRCLQQKSKSYREEKTFKKVPFAIIMLCFSLVVISNVEVDVYATDSEANNIKVGEIDDKFEPWLWDKIQNLTLANSIKEITLIVRLEDMDGNLTKLDKISYANLFAEKYDAEIVYIAEVLPVVIIKIPVDKAVDVATYEYVLHIGDGDQKVELSLNVSAQVVRARPDVWNLGYRGAGMRIAIIDTGIDDTHPDLDDIDDNPGTNDPKVILERDFTGEGTTDDTHPQGHGTHVAGIAAGTGQWSRTNLPVNSWFIGVAPEAFLFNCRVFNSTGWSQVSWIIQAIDWAVNNGADVINLSLGYPQNGDGTSPLSQAADYAVDRGVVVVVAANDYPDATGNYPIGIPADAFNVITVGAIDDHETVGIGDDTMPIPNWSGHGPTLDGRVKPDVVSPGVGIWSTGQWFRGIVYRSLSGTSMATPHVAGVVALILQAGPYLTPAQVKAILMQTARLNNNLTGLTVNDRGHGIIDAYAAVQLARSVPDVAVTGVTPVLPYGGTALYAGLQVPIEVTVENQGNFIETFDVTAYYDSTTIGTQTVTNLAAGDSMTLTFTWDTTDITGNYTISAQASIVSGETQTGDNTFIDGTLRVKVPGDINGDGIVDIYDAVLLIKDIDATPGSPDWHNGRSDINNNGKVDLADVIILSTNYGKTGDPLGGESGESLSPVYASPTKLSVIFPNGTTSSIGEYFPTETFTVNITVEDITNLYGFDFTLRYNASLLTAAPSVTPGAFFGSEYIIWHEEVKNDVGYVWYAVSQDTYEEAVNGSGTLATISFTVDSLGGTILDLWNTKLSDSDGNPIAHEVYDGSFANILKADLVEWKAKPAHKHHVISIHGTINPLYALVQNLGAQSVTVKVNFAIYADNGGAPVTSFETSEYTFEEGTYLALHIFDTSTDVTPSEFDSSLHGTGKFYVEAKCLYYDGANWIGGEIKTFSFTVIP